MAESLKMATRRVADKLRQEADWNTLANLLGEMATWRGAAEAEEVLGIELRQVRGHTLQGMNGGRADGFTSILQPVGSCGSGLFGPRFPGASWACLQIDDVPVWHISHEQQGTRTSIRLLFDHLMLSSAPILVRFQLKTSHV